MTTLFSAATANSNSTVFYAQNGGTLVITGTFDTCTVALQASYDSGTTWVGVTDASYTAETVKVFDADNGAIPFRLNLSSVGGSTSIDAVHVVG